MSVFTSPPPIPSSTRYGPSPTSVSNSNNGGGFSTASSFYRNLFYILVGVLVIFLVITFLSYIRTRRRRQIIEAEARRLGLLVPGMPGYLTERARLAAALKGQKTSAKETPLLWDVMSKESMKEQGPSDLKDQKLGSSDDVKFTDIMPIAITPLLPMPPLEPIPNSSLKFFPNAMAFRAPKPEISAETILTEWEAKLARGPNLQQDAAHAEVTGGRRRGRTRGKSLLEQYPQQHVPPLRLSIERPRQRKTSRAAELADQLGNKIFGPPSLPTRAPSGDIDLEAQVAAGSRSRANTGVEMVQIGAGATIASNTPHVNGRVDLLPSPLDTRKAASIPPTIQLMTFVRMPIPEHSRELVGKRTWHMGSEEDQEKAVQAEWAGVELGVTELEVVGDTYPAGGDVWGSSR